MPTWLPEVRKALIVCAVPIVPIALVPDTLSQVAAKASAAYSSDLSALISASFAFLMSFLRRVSGFT